MSQADDASGAREGQIAASYNPGQIFPSNTEQIFAHSRVTMTRNPLRLKSATLGDETMQPCGRNEQKS